MNLRQLEAFHSTIKTGSVTRAGERLGISQPAVSKLLRAFAEACGFRLFVRSGGRLVPTPEARLLAEEVERLFSGTERIARLARAVGRRERGAVTLAAPAALATRCLPQALAPFLATQPDLQLTLKSLASPQIVDMVASRQVDAGFSMIPVDDPRIRSELLIRYAMICVLPAGHPLAAREVIGIADLRDAPLISTARSDCMLMTIDRAFQIAGVQKHPRIEVPLSETACSLVAGGAGISIVPPFVGLDFGPEALVRRPLVPETLTDIWALTPADRPASLATEQVIGVIRRALAPFDAA